MTTRTSPLFSAVLRSKGSNPDMKTKCPTWFTANAMSSPSVDSSSTGTQATPAFAMRMSRHDVLSRAAKFAAEAAALAMLERSRWW